MQNSRILVTGSNGFIGSNLIRKLLNSDFAVVGVDLHEKSIIEGDMFTYVKSNLAEDSLNLEKLGVSKVVHCAAQTSVQYSMQKPISDLNSNITASIKLYLACREAEISNVTYLNSGGAIYGEMTDMPFKESDTMKPISPYAISKYSSELYGRVLLEHTNVNFVSLALGNVYGSVKDNKKGIFYEMWKAHNSKTNFKIFGPDCMRDYIYIDDVVSSIIRTLDFNGSERFNIASGIGTKNQDLLTKFNEMINNPLEIEIFAKRFGDIDTSIMDITKARQMLDWMPLVSLDDGMKLIF